jgi:hypothetical protein
VDFDQGQYFLWERILDATTTASVAEFAAPGAQYPLVPTLSLQLALLSPGTAYTFRVTAVLPCAMGANAYSQVSFVTNTAPLGGAVDASPTSGVASTTKFRFVASSFSDPDLPLKYMFEYQKDFSSSGSVLPLSSYSSNWKLSTELSTADRMKVTCRAKDSFGAVSSRATSPFVDNLMISAFVLDPNALPESPADIVADLLSEGASDEDILRYTRCVW